MELDDFKTCWKNHLDDELHGKLPTEYIKTTTMKISNVLTKLNQNTLYWWKFTKVVMILLFCSIAVNIAFFIFIPEKFQNLQNALPVFGVIAFYGLATLWVYYEKVKIFDIADATNIRIAIEKSIRRFNNWYVLSTVLYAFVLPLIFYVVVNIGSEAFLHTSFPLHTEVIICALLTIATLVGNHIYYKRTYFKWLALLRTSVKELAGE